MKGKVTSCSGVLIWAQPAHVSLRRHSFLCFPYPLYLSFFPIQLKQHFRAAFQHCHSPPRTQKMIEGFLSALLSCSGHNTALLLQEVTAANLPSFLRAASGKSGRIPEEKFMPAHELARDLVHKQNFEDLNDFVTWHSALFFCDPGMSRMVFPFLKLHAHISFFQEGKVRLTEQGFIISGMWHGVHREQSGCTSLIDFTVSEKLKQN